MMRCLLLMKSLNLQFSYIKVTMDFTLFFACLVLVFCWHALGLLSKCSLVPRWDGVSVRQATFSISKKIYKNTRTEKLLETGGLQMLSQ